MRFLKTLNQNAPLLWWGHRHRNVPLSYFSKTYKALNKRCVVSRSRGTQKLMNLYGLWMGRDCDETDKQWPRKPWNRVRLDSNEVPIQTYFLWQRPKQEKRQEGMSFHKASESSKPPPPGLPSALEVGGVVRTQRSVPSQEGKNDITNESLRQTMGF